MRSLGPAWISVRGEMNGILGNKMQPSIIVKTLTKSSACKHGKTGPKKQWRIMK